MNALLPFAGLTLAANDACRKAELTNDTPPIAGGRAGAIPTNWSRSKPLC